MLWHIILPVHYLVMDAVAKFLKRITYYFKGVPFVMGDKILDIFKEKSLWTMSVYDVRNIKKQCPLSLVFKPCLPAEAFLFRDPCY